MEEGPVFELDIERVRTRYQARVRRSAAGPGGRRSFSLPSENAVRLALANIHLRHLAADASPRQEGSPKEFGRRLFESVFAGPLLTAWRVAATQADMLLRLRLDDDPRLLRVPWELLFDPERDAFVAIERRVVRSLDLPEGRLPTVPPPLRVLVVLSSPWNVSPLDTDREWAVLDEALGEKVQLTVVPPRLDEVDHALRSGEWHILHFVGHGDTDGEGGFLILEDRQGDARSVDHLRLGRFLSHPSLRLVVLNACEGALPGGSDAFSGVAQALLKGGVPAVLAMQQAISDSAAISFAKHFYGALGRSLTIGGSLLEARQALYRDDEPEWAVPVLYLRTPDRRLIDVPPPSPPPSRKRLRAVVGLAAGAVLLGLLGLWINRLFSHSETKPLGLLPPRPPRSATENPEECPSPAGLNIAFEKIDAGIFEMGDKGSKSTRPVHKVRITEPYCLSTYEVTRELWSRVQATPMPRNEDHYLPVQGITFEEARQFFRRLSQLDPSGHYRLPTEAEWEKAARAGQRTLYHFGDDEAPLSLYGNCRAKDGFETVAPVGQLKANPEGLYDMYGNVFEWVEDWYAPYPAKDLVDPRGPVEGKKRIRRGGSWDSGARTCNSAARSDVAPDRNNQENGFRIVREIR